MTFDIDVSDVRLHKQNTPIWASVLSAVYFPLSSSTATISVAVGVAEGQAVARQVVSPY